MNPAVYAAGKTKINTQPESAAELRFGGLVHKPVTLLFAGEQRKIMSYNSENFFESRRGIVKRPKSVKALAEAIRQEDPDVIAFQEVGDRELLASFNQKHLDGKYPNVVIFPLPNNDRGIRVAIMSKRDVRVVDAKSHWKEQCGNNSNCGKRDFLEATFETGTGYRFTVYNGHFKSMRGGEKKTMPTRLSEATSAARIIGDRLKVDPDANLIVVGDLNTHHESQYGKPVIDTLTLRTDKDPGNDLTEVMLKDGKGEPTHRGGGPHKPSKLDYMFVSPNMLKHVKRAYVSGDFQQYPWKDASDHRPMVTVVEEPDAKPAARPAADKTACAGTTRLDLTA